jgi:hypothetical protein
MKKTQEAYSMKDFEEDTNYSEAYFRKMEQKGYVKFESEKVRGQVKRLFSQDDYNNALHIAALSSIGYGPAKLDGYKKLVKNFKKYIRPFLKKLFKDPDDLFFVFSSRDVFPDGDPDNLDWEKLNIEENERRLDSLKAIYAEALMMQNTTKTRIRVLKHIEKGLNKFITDVENGLGRTMSGQMFLMNIKQLKGKRPKKS